MVTLVVIGGGLALAIWSFSRQPGTSGTGGSPEPESPAGTITQQASAVSTSVPDVVSLPLDSAKERLRASGFKVGTVTPVLVDGFAPGSVVAQSPGSSIDAPIGSVVALTVSKGLLSANLPRVVGLSVTQAKNALAGAGFVVAKVDYVYSEEIKNGIVISLSADATRQPQRGDRVSLTASKGRAPVPMPSILGMSPAAAAKACRNSELVLAFRPAGATAGIITKQSPSAGSLIAPGSTAVATVDTPPRASISARITKMDPTWEKYNTRLGAHITCTSTSSDNQGIASQRWQVQGLDVSASGTGSEISFILPGYRKYGSTTVTLSVTDSAGQTTVTRKIIKVDWNTGTLQ